MKLLNHLFEIIESLETPSGFQASISLFPDHIIFKGHFPGHPITPGVIFLNIVHELIEFHLKKTIRLVELSNCKFLKIVNPEKESVAIISIDFVFEDDFLRVKALGRNESGNFFKLQSSYTM